MTADNAAGRNLDGLSEAVLADPHVSEEVLGKDFTRVYWRDGVHETPFFNGRQRALLAKVDTTFSVLPQVLAGEVGAE